MTFEELLKNLKLNDCRNVSARNVAATATACQVAIDRTELHNSGTHTIRLGEGEISVEGVPFRDIIGDEFTRVRLIKIDIEGSEAPILSGILEMLPDLPDDLIIAAELCPASAEHVIRFVAAGFRAYAISNIYTVDYYLIRSYLRRYREDTSIQMVPVSCYDPRCRDYIFERVDASNEHSAGLPKQLCRPHRTRANDNSAERPDHVLHRPHKLKRSECIGTREEGPPKLHRAFIFIVSR